MEASILIVDDEAGLRASLQEYFEREGFRVATAQDGIDALATVDRFQPDLIVLDVQLTPEADGLEVCRAVRQQSHQAVGIILISGSKKELVDRVVGLELGADVYLTKPFETRELLAQVRALLRRIQADRAVGTAAGWLIVDEHLRINFGRREVEAAGEPVRLTRQEFDLLQYLAQRPGLACARSDLLDEVWGCDQAGLETMVGAVNTCVARLRGKIEPDPGNPRYILSVHGIGYRFRGE